MNKVNAPKCPNCGQPMQFAESNATTDRYICGCRGLTHVNIHKETRAQNRN